MSKDRAGPRGDLAGAWLPSAKQAGIVFMIDDVHPATSADGYEAGGDLDRGALRHVAWLIERHPQLRVTLFVTPDWRETVPRPTARILSRIPVVRHRVFLTRLLAKGTMRLDRHPNFVRYLASLPRTDVGIHGLHHVHRGPRVPVEFQNEDAGTCRRVVAEAVEIFRSAGLSWVPGFAPPGWNTPPGLLEALITLGFRFLTSARDLTSAVSRDAVARMSGLTGVSLLYPELLMNGRLVHITTNFQATCPVDRALEILDCNGLLAIKAHIVKDAGGHVAADGLDELYRNYLDVLFRVLERRYGDALWWTSMDDVARAVLGFAAAPA